MVIFSVNTWNSKKALECPDNGQDYQSEYDGGEYA